MFCDRCRSVTGSHDRVSQPAGRIDLSLLPAQESYVSRGDVVAVAAAVLAESSARRRTSSFRGGETPIAEALRI